jgi:hypothetical protein
LHQASSSERQATVHKYRKAKALRTVARVWKRGQARICMTDAFDFIKIAGARPKRKSRIANCTLQFIEERDKEINMKELERAAINACQQ